MYLRYYLNEKGDRQYTLAKDYPLTKRSIYTNRRVRAPKFIKLTIDPYGKPTISAHPARFSPEDKYSRHRIIIKKRFGLLLTQQPEPVL